MNVLLRSASVLALSAVALAASAQSILSNLGGVYTPITNTTIFAGTIKAVGLTTGASPLSLVSMSVLMANQNFAAPETFTAGVYSNLNSAPGVQLAGLSSATVNSTTPSVFALTPLAPYVLAPNTTYWFVVSSASNSLNLNWNGLTPGTAPTPTGVSYVGYRISNDSGASWASSAILNGVNIQAQAVPEPSALAAVALLRRRKRARVAFPDKRRHPRGSVIADLRRVIPKERLGGHGCRRMIVPTKRGSEARRLASDRVVARTASAWHTQPTNPPAPAFIG